MENYNQYKLATEKADWRRICDINGVNFASFGVNKELEVLANYLESGEVVFALAAGLMKQTSTSNTFDFGVNTWLAVLTSERFLFLDAAMLTSSVDTQSIRIKNVQAISASQGFVFGKIMIDLGSRIVIVDNCDKEAVKVMAELGNRWIKELEEDITPSKEIKAIPEYKNKNKVSQESVMPPVSEGPQASRTAATVVTGLFGWFGLNDFIWGMWGAGTIKCVLNFFAIRLGESDHFILSGILAAIICVWVIVDLFRINDGSFFRDKKSNAVADGLTGLFVLIYVALSVLCLIGMGFEISDANKKDTGKLASVKEIVDTYNQNEAAADNLFDGKRFSIGGVIRSVEKDFFGDYVVKFEGLGALALFNLETKVNEIELSFSEKQSKELTSVRKGDIIIANCIGRGLSLGIYSADKCKLIKVRKKN
jgi:hypothetical protein